MNKKMLLIPILLLMRTLGFAQTPVWSTDVAPILYNHCTSCHHTGGIGPFSLITYDSALAYASSIKGDVISKKMPPWPPDPTYSHLAHERLLSTTEVSTIVNWVNGGAPSGTISLAPPAPTYPNSGTIPGTPDLVVKIPVYTSTASGTDVYQSFVIHSNLLTDKYIRAFEAIPGNPACVHHVLVFADTTNYSWGLDSAYAGPGYPDFGGVGSPNTSMLGVWVPGSAPMSYPAGFGLKIPHHADIVVQIHYPAGSAGLTDSTEVRFFFAPTPGIREVVMQPALYHDFDMTDGPLFIPADSVKTFHEKFPNFLGDISILGAFPHMHLIGRSIESFGVSPAGDTDKYIRINNWDFHWQGFYFFKKFKKVSAGANLWARATYDNTASNPENPNHPPHDVTVGENTTNEMMIVFFVYTAYQAGDESIIQDSILLSTPIQYHNYYSGQQLLDVCPNPAVNDMVIKCHMEASDVGSIELLDMAGRVVKRYLENATLNQGYTAYSFSVEGLPAGTYSLVVKTSQQMLSKKVVIR